jgi:hypothetical protein
MSGWDAGKDRSIDDPQPGRTLDLQVRIYDAVWRPLRRHPRRPARMPHPAVHISDASTARYGERTSTSGPG